MRSGGQVQRNADDVRYGKGPVRRLAEPRGVTGTRGARTDGASTGGNKTRRGDDATKSVGGRVQRDLDGVRKLDDSRPGTSDGLYGTGRTIDRINEGALRASVGSLGGLYRSPYRGGSDSGSGGYYGDYYGGYYGGYYYGWGCGIGLGWSWGWGCGVSWGYSSWWGPCNSYWWPWYVGCYYPLWYNYYRPYYYGAAYPAYWSSEVYRTVYVEEPLPEEEVVEQPVTVPNSLSIAADRYLTLGDRAFREGRYTDAVQFYAKAVEFAPGEGAMYLVLSDALFAAGDYHYAAYAIRRALELDPALVETTVDKHAFYPAPEEFDHQIATLETYVIDHPSDRDARLVLALNYLFGNRPAAAVDFLNSSASDALQGDPAAGLILGSARKTQFGEPVAPPQED